MTVKSLTVEDSTDSPTPKRLAERIEDVFRKNGENADILRHTEIPEHSELADNAGRTPKWAVGAHNPVKDLIYEQGFSFDLKELAEKEWDMEIPGAGKEHVTTFFNHLSLTVEETTEYLLETGQIEEAKKRTALVAPENVAPVDIVAFAVFTYAKGWIAEKLLSETAAYAKLWVTNDMHGQDLREIATDREIQLKSVTFAKDKKDHVYYQWDCRGGLHFGEDHKEVNKAAGEVSGRVIPYTGEITPTETLRCHTRNTDENGQSYRYLWW